MKAVLLLAADLLDRAVDTRLDVAANELAALRFERALADSGLRSELLGELVDEGDDGRELSFNAWLWLLAWRGQQGVAPDERVLTLLSRDAASLDRRLGLRALVGRDPTLNAAVGHIDEYRFRPADEPALPSHWLDEEITTAVGGRLDPYELMRHLLQISTDLTLAALFRLLHADGDVVDGLRRELRDRFGSYPEDQASRDQARLWTVRLGLDEDERPAH